MKVSISGGNGLAKAIAKIAGQVGEGKMLRVGFLEDATYPGGTVVNQAGKSVKQSEVSVATVAASQEFGTSRIPPRPFFRSMIADKKASWPDAMALQLKKNDYDVDKTLQVVGLGIKGQLQQSIIDTNAPPLAQSTIDRKGFEKPLIDTGHMINSVDYEISES